MLSTIHLFGEIFGVLGRVFGFLKSFLSLTFLENAMFRNVLRFRSASKQLETKLNDQKHIKILKFIKKIEEKKLSNFMEFLTVIDTFGRYNKAPT